MAISSSSSSSARRSGPVIRSLSPSGRFYSSSPSASSSGFASSTFTSRSSSLFQRSASPTRINLYDSPSSSASVRFSIDRITSPGRSISSVQVVKKQFHGQKRTCMCSPTTHPGSFRCSLHKNVGGSGSGYGRQSTASYPSNRLNARRSAMTNSLVRIGTVEGDLVKRALAALIRPSSHQQRRRTSFQPRTSRLSVMSTADDL